MSQGEKMETPQWPAVTAADLRDVSDRAADLVAVHGASFAAAYGRALIRAAGNVAAPPTESIVQSSPATVDVGEARALADKAEDAYQHGDGIVGANCVAYDVRQLTKTIRSLASALETSEKKVADLEAERDADALVMVNTDERAKAAEMRVRVLEQAKRTLTERADKLHDHLVDQEHKTAAAQSALETEQAKVKGLAPAYAALGAEAEELRTRIDAAEALARELQTKLDAQGAANG